MTSGANCGSSANTWRNATGCAPNTGCSAAGEKPGNRSTGAGLPRLNRGFGDHAARGYPPRLVPSRVVDIAGVPVAFRASDDERDSSLRASLAVFATTLDDPVGHDSRSTRRPRSTPTRPPHSELLGIKFWDEPDGIVVSAPPGLVITVVGNRAHVHLPDLAALPFFESCVYLPLTWLLARNERFVLHGAAIVRDGRALLLLGHSGTGKSTLAVSALEAGWQALADDVVIVHPDGDGLCIHGIHRVPAVPTEIGGQFADPAPARGSAQPRRAPPNRLDRRWASPRGRRAHHARRRRRRFDCNGRRAIRCFRCSPVVRRKHRPELARRSSKLRGRLSRLPVWELGHAADPTVRRERAAHHLERCVAELSV